MAEFRRDRVRGRCACSPAPDRSAVPSRAARARPPPRIACRSRARGRRRSSPRCSRRARSPACPAHPARRRATARTRRRAARRSTRRCPLARAAPFVGRRAGRGLRVGPASAGATAMRQAPRRWAARARRRGCRANERHQRSSTCRRRRPTARERRVGHAAEADDSGAGPRAERRARRRGPRIPPAVLRARRVAAQAARDLERHARA